MAGLIVRWMGAFWLVALILWCVAALTTKRAVQRQTGASRLLQAGLALIGLEFIFNFYPVFSGGWLGHRVVPQTGDWVLFGAALTLLGVLFAVWARLVLGRNWSGTVTIKENHQLMLRGPYAIVRHPIYTGVLFGLLGTSLVYGLVRCFVGVLIVGVAFRLKAQIEERFMMQQFGTQYVEYRQRVRALVPFVL